MVTIALNLEPIVCCECGITFGVPEYWQRKRREDHVEFYCPNGHCQAYMAKSEAETLRDELAQAKARKERMEAELETARRTLIKTDAELTKIKKRTKQGACPCCHRTFKNMQAHMKTKHPTFASNPKEPPV